MKPPLDVREDGGFETLSQPPQPGLTKAAGIAGNGANSLTTHGMKRAWDRVKPTGASEMSVPEQVDWGGCSLSLELAVGHIWCNPRRSVRVPGELEGEWGGGKLGDGAKGNTQLTGLPLSGKKCLEMGAKGSKGTNPIKSPSSTTEP